MVHHTLRLEYEKSMEMKLLSIAPASSGRVAKVRMKRLGQCHSHWGSEEGAMKGLAHFVQHGTQFLRRSGGINCLVANSRFLHSSWYAFSVFFVSGGGDLSTDYPVEGKSASDKPCDSSDTSLDRWRQEL